MIIDLLRHGEVDGPVCFRGHTDEALSENGWQQMRCAVGSYIPKTIITSPLKRCAEFAHDWANQYQINATTMHEFMELDFGDWDGLSVKQIQSKDKIRLSEFWSNPVTHTPPNGERLVDFQKRVVAGWNDLIQLHHNKNLVLITHGGVIKMLLAQVLSMPLESLLCIESPLASVSRVRISFDDKGNHFASLVSHASHTLGALE